MRSFLYLFLYLAAAQVLSSLPNKSLSKYAPLLRYSNLNFLDLICIGVLQLFRDNQPLVALLVLGYCCLFIGNTYWYPNADFDSIAKLPSSLLDGIQTLFAAPQWNWLVFGISILLQAYLINAIANEFRLNKQSSYITAICYILLHFSAIDLDAFTPVVVANFFLIWAIYSLFRSYDKKVSMGTVFNVGFATSMAALCYHGASIYIIWAIVGFLLVRSFAPQEMLVLMGGLFIPFFLMGTYQFLYDNLGNWWATEVVAHYSNMQLVFQQHNQWLLLVGILLAPSLLAFLNLRGLYFKTTAKEKKYINAILVMPIIGWFSLFLQQEVYSYHFALLLLPLSILLSLSLQVYKQVLLAEMLHLLLFMSCIGIQYQASFFSS